MSSFSENKVNKFIAKGHQVDLVDYNSRQLSRIYPKGLRVDSSNYDPVPAWNCGCQIVALNYQTGSESMWLNDGRFMDNGRCGYVLKPAYMRAEKITFDPFAKMKPVKTLEITVISASQLPKVQGKEEQTKGTVIDPYVSVHIAGVPADKRKAQTKTIKHNGFNPIFKNEFKFPLCNPDLAIVMFTVSDADLVSSDDFIGYYSLPFTCLREGVRTVPLKDKHGKVYEHSTVLVQIKIS